MKNWWCEVVEAVAACGSLLTDHNIQAIENKRQYLTHRKNGCYNSALFIQGYPYIQIYNVITEQPLFRNCLSGSTGMEKSSQIYAFDDVIFVDAEVETVGDEFEGC